MMFSCGRKFRVGQAIGTFLTFNYYKMLQLGAVVVAQLEERLLPIPEVFDSNPVIGKNLY